MAGDGGIRLDGKVALITGGASGQGRAAAVEFARAGAAVVVFDVNGDGLDETARLVRGDGGRCEVVVGSVTVTDDVVRAVATAEEAFGKLDVLYANAAIYLPGRGDAGVADLEEDVFQRVLDVNLRGVFLCAKHAIPAMRRAGGGSIVTVSSIGGTRGSRANHAYSASKGGVIALTYSIAATYGADGIRANVIAPGAIDTPMIPPFDEAGLAALYAHTPLRRVGDPVDVARVGLFLASDAAAYVTGTVQVVDGGFSIG
jgi:NAD(P)-dependent dehydrogenase (short-subunit alcohol dehydrogenase family)